MTDYQRQVLGATIILGGKGTCQQIADKINSQATSVAAAARRLQDQGYVRVYDENRKVVVELIERNE